MAQAWSAKLKSGCVYSPSIGSLNDGSRTSLYTRTGYWGIIDAGESKTQFFESVVNPLQRTQGAKYLKNGPASPFRNESPRPERRLGLLVFGFPVKLLPVTHIVCRTGRCWGRVKAG